MIKFGPGPATRHVTIFTLFAQFAFVNIIFRVAFITGLTGVTVLFVLLMTGVTFDQPVFAVEPEIGELMIELVLVQPDHPGIATLVIAVAGFTVQVSCVFVLAMKSLLVKDILGDLLVIVTTKA